MCPYTNPSCRQRAEHDALSTSRGFTFRISGIHVSSTHTQSLSCAIHTSVAGVLVPLPVSNTALTPWHASSEQLGEFRIDGSPERGTRILSLDRSHSSASSSHSSASSGSLFLTFLSCSLRLVFSQTERVASQTVRTRENNMHFSVLRLSLLSVFRSWDLS
jgi:hypothetical protein